MASENINLRELANDSELWVGDSGASRHLCKTCEGMVNERGARASENFTMGNGQNAKAAVVGDILGTVDSTKIKVSDVAYCPDAKFNLFSLSLMLKKGWTMHGNEDSITVSKGEGSSKRELRFDIKVNTSRGVLYCVRIKLNRKEEVATVLMQEKERKKMGSGQE